MNRAGQIVHCMVCWPKLEEFFKVFPHLSGEVVTSGFCPKCFEEFKAQFARETAAAGTN